jgi:hypothetical protein
MRTREKKLISLQIIFSHRKLLNQPKKLPAEQPQNEKLSQECTGVRKRQAKHSKVQWTSKALKGQHN